MKNPIDKDKTTEIPNILPYAHHIGSIIVKPEDVGKLKSRALTAMREQTNRQFLQLQKQAELIAKQANELKNRVEVSEKIYLAELSFEPFVGNNYYLYQKNNAYCLMMIGPHEWGKSIPETLQFINEVRLLSDHTWEIVST